MVKQLIVREIKWYLAYQDGPVENDVYYDTEKEAKAALKKIRPKSVQKGICVMSRTFEREPKW